MRLGKLAALAAGLLGLSVHAGAAVTISGSQVFNGIAGGGPNAGALADFLHISYPTTLDNTFHVSDVQVPYSNGPNDQPTGRRLYKIDTFSLSLNGFEFWTQADSMIFDAVAEVAIDNSAVDEFNVVIIRYGDFLPQFNGIETYDFRPFWRFRKGALGGLGSPSDPHFLDSAVQSGLPISFSTDGSGIVLTPAITPTPEPAVWALLISGFALVGGVLRLSRRRRPAGTGLPCSNQ